MKYVNLTAHLINVVDKKGHLVKTLHPSGMIARIRDKKTKKLKKDGLLFKSNGYEVIGLPPQKKDVVYIVSQIVMRLCCDIRTDVYAPYKVIKLKKKHAGCQGFYRVGKVEIGKESQDEILSDFIGK